jgi:hypothetical protein
LIGCGGAATADCERDPSTGESRCVPWPTLGQDCSPLSVRTCLLGDSYCDISGTCLALPEDGEPCGVDAWTGRASWCADDHSCDSEATPPTCRAPVTGGQPCEAPFPGCASGLNCECDDAACATRHCKRLRWPGESCSAADDLCLPGATRCEAGVCVGLNEVQGLFESRCMP